MIGRAVAVAHPNIALAKYWGKVPGSANAPAVPSLSVTLAGMETRTTVELDGALTEDAIEINGCAAEGRARERVVTLLEGVRRDAGVGTFARVSSHNDFPTAAGLASSASGFSALALAATAALGLDVDPARVSDRARRASASSARSLYGGYVQLLAGVAGDAFLAAELVAPPEALPLAVLVAVATEASKDVASTEGMNHTAATSPLYGAWVASAPILFARVNEAVLAGDLAALGDAAEASALTMHATALAARPAVIYWRGVTVDVLAEVRAMRRSGLGAWSTIDAGPHVKVLCAPRDSDAVRARLAAVPGVVRVLTARPGPGARVLGAQEQATGRP